MWIASLISTACAESARPRGDALPVRTVVPSPVPEQPAPTPEIQTPAPESSPETASPPSAAPVRSAARGPAPSAAAVRARVVGVTDGDTLVLAGIPVGTEAPAGRRVRLIGVDTPEVYGSTECFGREASAFTSRELGGRTVLVDYDVAKTDRYGRGLVYVWREQDGVFFNAKLAADGYATQMTVPPNVRYADLFGSLAREARAAGRGLWGAGCETGAHAATARPAKPAPTTASRGGGCHPSYPDFCIAPPPPDLNCPDIPRKNFRVRWDVDDPDPHGFDRDRNGIGCQA